MSTIAKAFVAAKKEFAPALKTATNPHFKSKYADLAGCLEAVNEALLNNGIALYQETFEDGTGVTIETVFLHESGESLRGGKLHVPAAKQDPQGYGSALTYARRYSVMSACGIAAEDDDGNGASRKPKNPLDGVAKDRRPDPAPADVIPLYVPGKYEPHAVHPDQDTWVQAYQYMMGKIENSAKTEIRERMTKLREFRECNEFGFSRLDAASNEHISSDYSLRLKRLGAQQ
mgnify:FL=1